MLVIIIIKNENLFILEIVFWFFVVSLILCLLLYLYVFLFYICVDIWWILFSMYFLLMFVKIGVWIKKYVLSKICICSNFWWCLM